MSTTVTYKGSTLTTVENATKKLTTAGTWLEDDITIQDSSSGGGSVVVVDTHDSHGGTIREITAQNTVMLQGQKTVSLTTSPQTITPDTGYDGFASVVVDIGQLGAVTQDQDGYLVLSPNGGSGGMPPKIMGYEEVLVASTATNINVQLTPSESCVVMLIIQDIGEPDASMYKSLYWSQGWVNGTSFGSNASNAILRPNGTIGTDTALASFNKTTGVLSFGNGTYGKAFAGDTYYVYQFSM